MSAPPSHFVFESSAWCGNSRPLIALALNLLAHHDDIHVTWVLSKNETHVKRTLAEINRFRFDEKRLERFHALTVEEVEKTDELKTDTNFPVIYKALLQGGRVHDARTKSSKFSLPLPTAVAGETFLLHLINAHKVTAESQVLGDNSRKIFLLSVWSPSLSFASAGLFKDSHLVTHLVAEGLKILKTEGNKMTEAEVWTELVARNTYRIQTDERISIFSYEAEPSVCVPTPGWSQLIPATLDLHFTSPLDGIIFTSTKDLDPLFEERALKTYKRVWIAGVQLPEVGWSTEFEDPGELTEERNSGEVESFLESALEAYGEQSVLFISQRLHGTLRSSSKPSTLSKYPFLMAEGTADEERKALIARHVALSNGRALLVPWVAQQAVLAHKPICAFLTHCGAGSTNEAIIRGVPMICWPGTHDQPFIAIELTLIHKVALELMQVRVDFNIGRPTTRGVFVTGTPDAVREEMLDVFGRVKLNGPEFAGMRERLAAMKETMVHSKAKGSGYEAMMGIGRLRASH